MKRACTGGSSLSYAVRVLSGRTRVSMSLCSCLWQLGWRERLLAVFAWSIRCGWSVYPTFSVEGGSDDDWSACVLWRKGKAEAEEGLYWYSSTLRGHALEVLYTRLDVHIHVMANVGEDSICHTPAQQNCVGQASRWVVVSFAAYQVHLFRSQRWLQVIHLSIDLPVPTSLV